MAGSRFLDGVVATDQRPLSAKRQQVSDETHEAVSTLRSRESLRSAAHMVDVDPHFSTRKVCSSRVAGLSWPSWPLALRRQPSSQIHYIEHTRLLETEAQLSV